MKQNLWGWAQQSVFREICLIQRLSMITIALAGWQSDVFQYEG